jgi:hypothetical protein
MDHGENCIMMNFINLHSSLNIVIMIKSRRMRWAGHVEPMGEGRGVYRVLVGRLEGKKPLARPRCRWEGIKMDLRETGIDGTNWIWLAQDRVQWWTFCVHGNGPLGSIRKQDIF